MERSIEVIARGVCIRENQLLLCRTKGDDNTYLPGGHVDFEESAVDALTREIREELGLESETDSFLGAVEHRFVQEGTIHCEINLVFELIIDAVDSESEEGPESLEDHIEFLWIPIDSLADSGLEPAALIESLPLWLKYGAGWGSNY